MKKIFLVLLVLTLTSGCGANLKSYPAEQQLLPAGPTLWEVRIGRHSSQFFAGLLALNKKNAVLEAVLLDSTGIKLVEEKILSTGEVQVISVLPALRNSRLSKLLGEGLARLFFNRQDAGTDPCRREGLLELCFGTKEDGSLVKFRRIGPFVLWSGDYFINNHDSKPVVTGARLNGGWLTPYLQLEKSGNGQSR